MYSLLSSVNKFKFTTDMINNEDPAQIGTFPAPERRKRSCKSKLINHGRRASKSASERMSKCVDGCFAFRTVTSVVQARWEVLTKDHILMGMKDSDRVMEYVLPHPYRQHSPPMTNQRHIRALCRCQRCQLSCLRWRQSHWRKGREGWSGGRREPEEKEH